MDAFDEVFAQLRSVMLQSAEGQVVARDEPGDLVLRTRRLDPKSGEPGWFGTVTVKKSYVAYHLMPLYEHTTLSGEISGELSKRRHGKTCFNFKTADPALFVELAELTSKANELVACEVAR